VAGLLGLSLPVTSKNGNKMQEVTTIVSTRPQFPLIFLHFLLAWKVLLIEPKQIARRPALKPGLIPEEGVISRTTYRASGNNLEIEEQY
jgi:hypothetical protein